MELRRKNLICSSWYGNRKAVFYADVRRSEVCIAGSFGPNMHVAVLSEIHKVMEIFEDRCRCYKVQG